MSVTLFICRGAGSRVACSTAGCNGWAQNACVHALTGKATGRTCGRAICDGCAGSDGLCPPHRRRRADEAKGVGR